ncbi:MAG: peptide chain release factor N(5)-glutamine methyltransferase [Prevotella sp.]|nr:peptide chain release factor N(5)-glutamine methyltransferase [Prevotella sp.]
MDYRELCRELVGNYDEREARAVVMWLLDVAFGLTSTEVLCGALDHLSHEQCLQLRRMMDRLRDGEPVQYVVGMADFGPHQFVVGPGVLIPRPETYKLCQWVVADSATATAEADVLDIGTGSGCIAITLALALPQACVTAWDVSPAALEIARNNAKINDSIISYELCDALCPPSDEARWDIIVSNPPYVCESERKDMESRVLDHEPSLALFVPDNDPLRYYRAIGSYAFKALKPGGRLFFELNAAYAADTRSMLKTIGYGCVELRDDQFGRPRFLKAMI